MLLTYLLTCRTRYVIGLSHSDSNEKMTISNTWRYVQRLLTYLLAYLLTYLQNSLIASRLCQRALSSGIVSPDSCLISGGSWPTVRTHHCFVERKMRVAEDYDCVSVHVYLWRYAFNIAAPWSLPVCAVAYEPALSLYYYLYGCVCLWSSFVKLSSHIWHAYEAVGYWLE